MLSVRRDSEGVTVSFSCSVVTTVTVTGPVSCDSLTWRGAALLLWTSACSSVWTYTWKHMNSSCNTGREHSSLRHSESLRTFLQPVWATRASPSMFTLCLTVCLKKLCKLLLKCLQLNFVSSPQAALFDHLIKFTDNTSLLFLQQDLNLWRSMLVLMYQSCYLSEHLHCVSLTGICYSHTPGGGPSSGDLWPLAGSLSSSAASQSDGEKKGSVSGEREI